MLKSLFIKNYALIEQLQISFGKGLNILTGETGTGKSIVIGAMGLLLGERIKTDIIRQGEEKAVVEASLKIPDHISLDFLDQEILAETSGGEVLIRREVNSNGRSRCFINDSPVQLSTLSELGNLLIDLHGQHEHQALFRVENHLSYLDNYINEHKLLEDIKICYSNYLMSIRELDKLKNEGNLIKKKYETLSFQIEEIKRINPQPGEDLTLDEEERVLRHSEKLHETFQTLESLLYDNENAVIVQLSEARRLLGLHANISDKFTAWSNECDSARIAVQELFKNIQDYISQIDYNPQRLEEIRVRLSSLLLLKKKYGGSLDEVIRFFQQSMEEIEKLESLDETIAQKEKNLETLRSELSERCIQLSKIRAEKAELLSAQIIRVLSDLGIHDAIVQIQVTQKEQPGGPVQTQGKHYSATENGMDQAEFLISLNPGESPKPLRTIASGGEVSRIMLAMKTVLAETDNIPILIFDEIDTGISGRIARVVGRNLKDISARHQIICITHLAQIASLGDTHHSVMKEVTDGRTRTIVRCLDEKERIIEIAKLLGGETVTESTLKSAEELMK